MCILWILLWNSSIISASTFSNFFPPPFLLFFFFFLFFDSMNHRTKSYRWTQSYAMVIFMMHWEILDNVIAYSYWKWLNERTTWCIMVSTRIRTITLYVKNITAISIEQQYYEHNYENDFPHFRSYIITIYSNYSEKTILCHLSGEIKQNICLHAYLFMIFEKFKICIPASNYTARIRAAFCVKNRNGNR